MDGAKIKAYLAEHGVYQYQLADKLKVSETHLSKVLRGRAKPSKQLILNLQKILSEDKKDE